MLERQIEFDSLQTCEVISIQRGYNSFIELYYFWN